MRLWHYKFIPYLPKSQLLAQWRELNSIFKNQPNHILINYVYSYNKEYLRTYSWIVIEEMQKRGYSIQSLSNMIKYFEEDTFYQVCDKFYPQHDERYLTQCYYNLQEKYDRGQKDFSKKEMEELQKFYNKEMMTNNYYLFK